MSNNERVTVPSSVAPKKLAQFTSVISQAWKKDIEHWSNYDEN